MPSSKNILVTGGAGYIGSHTVVSLIEAGYSPYILDDFRNSDTSVIHRLAKITGRDIPFFPIDICSKEVLFASLQPFDFVGVIHFAAYKAVGESVQEPLKYYHNNLVGLINILEWCQSRKVANFVFSSSCTVYGEPESDKMVHEKLPYGEAKSPYGQTKIIGEQLLNAVSKSDNDFKTLNLRYFNPIGAHSSGLIGELPLGKPMNLLPFVTQTAIGKLEELVVFGNDYPTIDGTCLRDYIHVSDLADAHVKGLEYLISNNNSVNEAVNIGTGKATSTLQIIHTFEKLTGVQLNWKFGQRRSGDVVKIYANTDKAMQLLGWKSKHTLEKAILDAWNWELMIQNEK